MLLRLPVLVAALLAVGLPACGSDPATSPASPPKADTSSAPAAKPDKEKTKATTPEEVARQTRFCDELFSPDRKAPTGTRSMDLIYDYLQDDPTNPELDVEATTEVRDDLRKMSARAPEWLAPHVAAMANGLDLLQKIAAANEGADDIDAATFADLVAGGKATLAICLPPRP